jgi:hypothetical protein
MTDNQTNRPKGRPTTICADDVHENQRGDMWHELKHAEETAQVKPRAERPAASNGPEKGGPNGR